MESDIAVFILMAIAAAIAGIIILIANIIKKRNQRYVMKGQPKPKPKTDNLDNLMANISEAEKNKPPPEPRGEVQPFPPETTEAYNVILRTLADLEYQYSFLL